jgi:hypothetical protein
VKRKDKPPRCSHVLRSGVPCQGAAIDDGMCSGHFEQRAAVAAENAIRAARGEPPMNPLEEDRFLKARRKALRDALRQKTLTVGVS